MDRSEGQEEYSRKKNSTCQGHEAGKDLACWRNWGKKKKIMKYSDMSEGM